MDEFSPCFKMTLSIARFVRQIVVRTNSPVDVIISDGDVVTSAKAIAVKLLAQIRPVRRVVLLEGLNFLRLVNSRAQGMI